MRESKQLKVIIGVMITTFIVTATFASSQSDTDGILDGMVFIGHVGPKGKEANGEDEVVFQNGRFLSASCSKYGFGSAPYTAYKDGETIIFTTVTQSLKHGQIDWKGRITGDEIEASYRWTKERWYWFDANEEHWLRAQLKKE